MAKVIWTNHLSDRIRQRGMDPRWIDSAVRFPDRVEKSATTDSNKHIKLVNGFEIIAAVKRQGSDWIITSAWWKPVYGQTKGRSHPAHHTQKFFLETWISNLILWIEKKLTQKR